VNPQSAALPPLPAQRAPGVPVTWSRFALWQPRTPRPQAQPQPPVPDLSDLDQRVRLSGEW